MDSIKYEFDKENREKKNIARNAAKRKNGSKSKKCSLPCDRLTPKQLKALNGEVITFALNRPCRFEDLIKVDKALSEEYLCALVDRFNVTVICISRMLGIGEATFYKWLSANEIDRPKRHSKFMSPDESQSWNDWLASFGWTSGYHKLEQYPVDIKIEAPSSEEEEVAITAEGSEPDAFGKLLTSFTATVETTEQLDELYKLMNSMLSIGKLSITVER